MTHGITFLGKDWGWVSEGAGGVYWESWPGFLMVLATTTLLFVAVVALAIRGYRRQRRNR